MTGKPWTEQTPTRSLLELVRQAREDARAGRLVLAAWDHNHPDREAGRSNKQLKIAGAHALHASGVELSDITYDQARNAILELAFGPAPAVEETQ